MPTSAQSRDACGSSSRRGLAASQLHLLEWQKALPAVEFSPFKCMSITNTTDVAEGGGEFWERHT